MRPPCCSHGLSTARLRSMRKRNLPDPSRTPARRLASPSPRREDGGPGGGHQADDAGLRMGPDGQGPDDFGGDVGSRVMPSVIRTIEEPQDNSLPDGMRVVPF
jgi:hypothetical protein